MGPDRWLLLLLAQGWRLPEPELQLWQESMRVAVHEAGLSVERAWVRTKNVEITGIPNSSA
jgi:hypothetical protein